MSSVSKNYIYSLCYQILSLLIPMITTPYLSRVLGAEKIGVYSYTNSIVQYFVLVAMLGISDHGNRSIASCKSKEDISNKFWSIYIVQSIMAVGVIGCYVFYWKYFAVQYKTIVLIQGIALISSLFDINWLFWGKEKFSLTVTRNIIIKICSLIAIFMFVKDECDLEKYIFIVVFSNLLNNLVLWLYLRKEVNRPNIRWKDIKENILPSMVLFIPLVSRSIFVYLDKTMLGILSGMTETGYYEYSERLILAATSVLTALGTVMLPRISSLLAKGEKKKAYECTELSMDYVTGLGFALMFGMASISDILSISFLGDNFRQCGTMIKIMSSTILLVGWTNVIRTQYIVPNRKDKEYILAVLLGAIVDFLINCLLIPEYGASGAAIGWVAAELVIAITQTYYASKELPILRYLYNARGYVISGLIMFIILDYVSKKIVSNMLSVLVLIGLGGIVYGILSAIYIIIFRKELYIRLRRR